ncbi:MAG TPA: c-type cytochrome [Steroidobacteraceae bacterium]|nr:c-type cytochrome [Steroidobacteraceae bacterium]
MPAAKTGTLLALLSLALLGSATTRAVEESAASLEARAFATTPDAKRGAALYARHCERCHRARGSGTGERQFPKLAGQQERYLLMQLAQFATLERNAPRMHRVLSADDIADPQSLHDLSFYLAEQRPDPHGEHGDGYRLGRGREIYASACSHCHGNLGEGRAEGPVPSIEAQNFTYLVEQLRGFAAGHPPDIDPRVISAVSGLSANDRSAVADFISRLPESAAP